MNFVVEGLKKSRHFIHSTKEIEKMENLMALGFSDMTTDKCTVDNGHKAFAMDRVDIIITMVNVIKENG